MIQGLCNFGRWKEARDLYDEMVALKVSPDVVTCNIVVDAYCKEGMMTEAEDVCKYMMLVDIHPDFTYNALIDRYCLRGEMGKARQVFNSAVDSGLKRNIVSYNCLMNGYCRKGEVTVAWRLFLEIPRKRLEHTVVSYNTMIQGFFRKGRCADALKLFKEMHARKLSPNIITNNILLEGIQEAKDLMMKMEESGCLPDGVTYDIFVQGFLKWNEPHDAIPLFDEMNGNGFKLDVATCEMLIGPLQAEGQDGTLFNKVKKIAPKSYMFD